MGSFSSPNVKIAKLGSYFSSKSVFFQSTPSLSNQLMFLISRDALSATRDVTNDVDFLLWTRRNPKDAQHLKVGDVDGLNATNFDKTLPTKILVHGYDDTGTTGWVLNVRTKYLDKGLCI